MRLALLSTWWSAAGEHMVPVNGVSTVKARVPTGQVAVVGLRVVSIMNSPVNPLGAEC